MKEKLKAKQSGITLVALVVTIVVLLILAGITIMYTVGDNGILKAAQDAKKQTEDAIKNEQQSLGDLANQLKEMYGGGNNQGGDAENPDNPNPDIPVVDVPIENIKTNWEEIDKIAQEIAKDDSITSDSEEVTVTVDGNRYTIRPGNIFEVQYDGTNVRVRVLGFKHDDLVDQTVYGGTYEKASISFEILDFMTGMNTIKMNNSATNSKGWGNTQMRKELNGYLDDSSVQNGTIGGLGINLSNKNYIKQVKKKYIGTYNSTSSVTTCNDYLWLLACSEIWSNGYQDGAYGYAITSEGNQYQYYKGINPTYNLDNKNLVKKAIESNNPTNWWLRSPYFNEENFCHVDSYGNLKGGYASYSMGVTPGFCI